MKENKRETPEKGSKISPIRIDQELLEDPKMDEMIRESLKQEADDLEKELNENPSLAGIKAPDDLFEKIVAKLKAEGDWEEEPETAEGAPRQAAQDTEKETAKKERDEEAIPQEAGRDTKMPDLERLYSMLPKEDQEALKLGKELGEKQKKRAARRKKRVRFLRRAGAVAAMLVLVFGISMTSDANRKLVMRVWDGVAERFGLQTGVDYVDDNRLIESQSEEEKRAFEEIKEKLGIEEFSLDYLPKGMTFQSCEVDAKTGEAIIYYLYEETIFYVLIRLSNSQTSFYDLLDGEYYFKEKFISDQGIEIEIWEAQQESLEKIYASTFENEDYSYLCNGEIEYSEFVKILNFLIVD